MSMWIGWDEKHFVYVILPTEHGSASMNPPDRMNHLKELLAFLWALKPSFSIASFIVNNGAYPGNTGHE